MNINLMNIHKDMARDLSSRLEMCTQISPTFYNARCPVCKDSKKDLTKKRFFIHEKGNTLRCYCHNCAGTNKITSNVWISTFIKELHPDIYLRYSEQMASMSDNNKQVSYINTLINNPNNVKLSQFIKNKKESVYPKKIFNMVRLDILIDKAPNHLLSKYIVNRQIPKYTLNRLYATEDFKKDMLNVPSFKVQVEKLYDNTKAIIMPLFNSKNILIGFQARFMSDTFRFLTLMLPNEDKIFGAEQLNTDIDHYILEAPLDSLHIKNSVATLDSNLNKASILSSNFIYIHDNQPRSKEITNIMEATIRRNDKIVIFSLDNKLKDVNDMITKGYIKQDLIMEYIRNNTYQGEEAMDKFLEWKLI